jgi:superfamily I DNA and/or RNA helicase
MAFGQLSDHYRMHHSIASLIKHHYKVLLQVVKKEQLLAHAPLNIPTEHPLNIISKSRTLFIETPPDNTLKKNINEARLAAWIANTLIIEGILPAKEIGIITPFRAQIAEIKRYIPIEVLEQDELVIDTVERYQGDERKLIIISTTVASRNQVGNIQSIASHDPQRTDRKLLVSLSRAKDQLIILGSSFALESTEAYRHLLDQIRQNNGYISRTWTDHILQII